MSRNFPPSLNKIPGKSDAELSEGQILGDLYKHIEGLTARVDFEPEEHAQRILGAMHFAKSILRRKRKNGTAPPKSVAKQLRDIQTASDTLLRRLNDGDKNVFEAWAAPSLEDHQNATQEWLQLKSLLQQSSARGRSAAKMAEEIVKLWSKEGKRGRREDFLSTVVTHTAKQVYESATGGKAARSISRIDGKPQGGFNDFLAGVFDVLGIKASPDTANRKMQTGLKQNRP